jgi:hypothetical protein
MAPRPQLESYQYGSISVNSSLNKEGDEETPLVTEPANGLGGTATMSSLPSLKTMAVCFTSLAVVAGVFLTLHGTHSDQSSGGNDNMGDFSPLSSPIEMGLQFLQRESDASPSKVWSESLTKGPLPTNSWFLVR